MSVTAALAFTLSFVGLLLATAGIALIYPPAALIFGGTSLACLGLFVIDVPPTKDKEPPQ